MAAARNAETPMRLRIPRPKYATASNNALNGVSTTTPPWSHRQPHSSLRRKRYRKPEGFGRIKRRDWPRMSARRKPHLPLISALWSATGMRHGDPSNSRTIAATIRRAARVDARRFGIVWSDRRPTRAASQAQLRDLCQSGENPTAQDCDVRVTGAWFPSIRHRLERQSISCCGRTTASRGGLNHISRPEPSNVDGTLIGPT